MARYKIKRACRKISSSQVLGSEEMIILVLKAQLNHSHHLNEDIRADIKIIREDAKELREDMNKRFDAIILRMDRFMLWSLGLIMTSAFIILGFIYKVIRN